MGTYRNFDDLARRIFILLSGVPANSKRYLYKSLNFVKQKNAIFSKNFNHFLNMLFFHRIIFF